MSGLEISSETFTDTPHFYEIQALYQGVGLFRRVTPADLSRFSDDEVLRIVRAVFGARRRSANLAERIDADYKAILHALNTLGEPLREVRSGSGN
jgi:hypothetical protein